MDQIICVLRHQPYETRQNESNPATSNTAYPQSPCLRARTRGQMRITGERGIPAAARKRV